MTFCRGKFLKNELEPIGMLLTRKGLKKSRERLIAKEYDKKKRERLNAIKNKLKQTKGTPIQTNFSCSLCNHSFVNGYAYMIEGEEYIVCKHCNNKIHPLNRTSHQTSVRVIYTPMGNKR